MPGTGRNTGDATVTFEESNGHKKFITTVHVYRLSLANTIGTTTIGKNLETNIIAENIGNLSCLSSNNDIATCSIEDNKLIVTPISIGKVTITVKGDKCGTATYNATINEQTPEEGSGS